MTEPTPPRKHRRWLAPGVAGGLAVVLAVSGVAYVWNRPAEPGFGSPEAISELLAERGAPCADFAEDGQGRADQRGICHANGEKIIIATFDSHAEVEEHWRRQIEVAADNEAIGMVIGETWSISGRARAYLRHAAEILDAEYRSN